MILLVLVSYYTIYHNSALTACVKYCTKDQSNVKGVKDTLQISMHQMLCNGMYVEDGVEQKCVCIFFPNL